MDNHIPMVLTEDGIDVVVAAVAADAVAAAGGVGNTVCGKDGGDANLC